MSQLTKGMYGNQFENKSRLFGLGCGQIRSNDFVHNGGWYNVRGEKLGWGDLSPEDFMRIRNEVEDGEFFIILHESESFWNFVTRPNIIGSMAAVKPNMEAPGVDYVAEKCRFIIGRQKLYYIDEYRQHRKGETMEVYATRFEVLSRDEAKELIAKKTATATPTPAVS